MTELTRREVLRWLAYGGAGAAVAGPIAWNTLGAEDARPANVADPLLGKWNLTDRILVVIELGGGNDGLSTLAPMAQGAYQDLRPTMALPDAEIIDFADGWGLNARLAGLQKRGLSLLAGVGTAEPDLSHFEMLDRWYAGTTATPATRGRFVPGFLGRICDQVGDPDELVGMSLRFGDTPITRAGRTRTVSLGAMTANPLVDPAAAAEAREALTALTAGIPSGPHAAAQRELSGLLDVMQLVNSLPSVDRPYPRTELGDQLAFTSRLIAANLGLRVIHVPMGPGNRFDTHKNHKKLHADLMVELNDALATFVDHLTAAGVIDKVLIATTSEFGRRPGENGDGLDHGTASTMMLMGPVVPGLHGEPSSLTKLDELDNLVATIGFDRYYATLAAWLDVDPADVLAGSGPKPAQPITGILAS